MQRLDHRGRSSLLSLALQPRVRAAPFPPCARGELPLAVVTLAPAHVAAKLLQLCQALDAGDWAAANHLQVELTASDWDEAGAWLTALKRLLKARQMMG